MHASLRRLGMRVVVANRGADRAHVPASAQAPYPNRPIRIVVPYTAGTGIDILARVDRPEAVRAAQGRRRRREPPGRERQHRHRGRRQGRARRLHAADDREHARHQRGAAGERAVRSGEELHADRPRRGRQSRAGRASVGARDSRCRSWSRSPRRSRASSTTPRPAAARRIISRWSSSSCISRSTSRTCRTRAPRAR